MGMVSHYTCRGVVSYYYTVNRHTSKNMKLTKGYTSTGKKVYYMKKNLYDEDGKMNLSIRDVNGAALVVSQFTLVGDWRKGRRPSFTSAATPEEGERLYEYFCGQLRQLEVPVQTGEFGTMMDVSLINDGPVTFVLDEPSVDP